MNRVARMAVFTRLCLVSFFALACCPECRASDYFTIEVLDSATGRGVPLVEITTGGVTRVTDSNGIVAFYEPGLMDQSLSFSAASYGYEPASAQWTTSAGGLGQVSLNRLNRAERLYRATGKGIYEDSLKVGRPVPIDNPLINANVAGQDSVQATIYNDQIHWFWGDTLYDVGFGNFRTSGAVSPLPGQGGLPPSTGTNFTYFEENGSSRQMFPWSKPGPVWVDGLFTVPDNSGVERLLTHFVRVESFTPVYQLYEQGLAIYNDVTDTFAKIRDYPLDARITPAGHSFRHNTGGEDWIYFAQSYPNIRVRANYDDVLTITEWEAFTPLVEGTAYDPANPQIERDAFGDPVYGWKKNTTPMNTDVLEELVQNGHIDREQAPFGLVDYETGQDVRLHRASVYWNDYRDKWVMIGNESFGSESFLGEVWYAEAPTPEGPWKNAIKVATHGGPGDDYSFYNPKHQPFFDEDGGRVIYFEGTYSATFSGNPNPTPLYDYNQLMYRLDLSTIPALSADVPAADFNADGLIDQYDWAVALGGFGISADGDTDSDGDTDLADLLRVQRQYSPQESGPPAAVTVPEPRLAVLLLCSLAASAIHRGRLPSLRTARL